HRPRRHRSAFPPASRCQPLRRRSAPDRRCKPAFSTVAVARLRAICGPFKLTDQLLPVTIRENSRYWPVCPPVSNDPLTTSRYTDSHDCDQNQDRDFERSTLGLV